MFWEAETKGRLRDWKLGFPVNNWKIKYKSLTAIGTGRARVLWTYLPTRLVAMDADLAVAVVATTNYLKPRRVLLDLPNEVIHNVAVYLLCTPSPSSTIPLGPPRALLPLLLTHSQLYFTLSPRHNWNLWIWREAYRARFDEGAAIRRCAADVTSSTAEGDVRGHGAFRMPAARWLDQLMNNCKALRFFRQGHVVDDRTREAWPTPLAWVPPSHASDPLPSPTPNPIHQLFLVSHEDNRGTTVEQALMTVLVMALENDGKNARQMIEWGHVRKWCLEAMEKRWLEENMRSKGPEDMDWGWADENPRNSLVVNVFWMLCDQDTLPSIPEKKLKHICDLLSPIVHNPYRYAASEYPPQFFHLPLPSPSSSSSTVSAFPTTIPSNHGAYPPLPPHPFTRQVRISHYGATTLLSIPLISTSAKPLYFAISELLYPFPEPAETAKDRRTWLSKRDMKEFTRGHGGWEMTKEEYMREWRRRGEKRATKEDVDEINWSWFAMPPLVREVGLPEPSFGPGSFSTFDIEEDIEINDQPYIKNLVYPNYADKSIVRRWRGKAPFLSPSSLISKSLSYEAEYWRLRLCSYGADPRRSLVEMGLDGGMEAGAMKVRPGRVYEVGSMAGCWVGWMAIYREETLRTLLSATSLRHDLVYRYEPVFDPVTGEPVIDPSTGEHIQESTIVGVKRTPQDPAPQMPVVMRLWEAHLLTSMMSSVAGAISSPTSSSAETTASAEEEQDLFWTSVDRSINPTSSRDNMLNAWFPGFPGTTKVTLVSSEDPENHELDAEIELEGWNERKRKVRCRVWNGNDGEQELLGNESLAVSLEEPLDSTSGFASATTSAPTFSTYTPPASTFSASGSGRGEECTSCFVHRIPVKEHTNTTVEGIWTGHGYTHLASATSPVTNSSPSSHTTTASSTTSVARECKECVARIKVDRHLARQRLHEQKRKEEWKCSEKRKVWNEKMKRVREEKELRECQRAEEQRLQDEQAERLFASVGLGVGTSAHDDELDEDFDEDQYSDEDDNTTSISSVPSTVSSYDDDGDVSESSFEESEYMFDPVPSYFSNEEDQGVQAPPQQHDEDDEFSETQEYYRYQHPSIYPSIPLSKLGTAFSEVVETVPKETTGTTSRMVDPSSTSTPSSTRTIHSSTQGCSGIRSITLFGTSGEERHGDAWGRYRFYGRVREWDGLVGLLRVPVRGKGPRFMNPTSSGAGNSTAASSLEFSTSSAHPYSRFLSTHIDARTVLLNGDLLEQEDDGDRNMILFYGYVGNGGESFNGNWRSVANGDVERPGNEGSFVLGRRRD